MFNTNGIYNVHKHVDKHPAILVHSLGASEAKVKVNFGVLDTNLK